LHGEKFNQTSLIKSNFKFFQKIFQSFIKIEMKNTLYEEFKTFVSESKKEFSDSEES